MNGMPSLPVISFSRPATSSCSSRDSTTHGPAMRKSGLSRPASKPQSFKLRLLKVCRRGAGRARVAQGRFDERFEQRMPVARGGSEFRVELHADEEGVAR